jgi:acetyl esterase/lipase
VPAFVRVHGGAWTHGVRGGLVRWDRWLSERGYDVFDVSYRLPPPQRWRQEVGDVKCAVGWVAAHAAAYGVDPGRIGLVGYSAGGNLALLAAYSMGDPRLPPSCPVAPVRIRSVINMYGPSDLTRLYDKAGDDGHTGYLQTALRRYIGGSPLAYPGRYRLLSPLSHVGPAAPPTLSLRGDRDRLIPAGQITLLDRALARAGVAHRSYTLPFADHGFDANWSSLPTQLARGLVARFLARYAGR